MSSHLLFPPAAEGGKTGNSGTPKSPDQEWWQKLRECLLQRATLHDQFAQNLEIARQNYSESEQQMVHALQSTQSDIAPL